MIVPAILKELLDPTFSYKNDPVFNINFSRWKGSIARNVRNRFASSDYRYERGSSAELLKFANEHALAHEKKRSAPSSIALVHPFYLFLSHGRIISPEQRGDAETYLDNLSTLFFDSSIREKTDIILFETLHHYAAASSRLLEKGMVNKVIFTEYDQGIPLDEEEIDKEYRYYFGGGYDGCCLKSSLYHIGRRTKKAVTAIEDLVLLHPSEDIYGLFPSKIFWPSTISKKRRKVIKLAQLLQE